MPFKIVRSDITKMKVDIIVNAANNGLLPGGGVCGAIFHAAGYERLSKACAEIGRCDTGDAVITKGYDLPAKYIIHTPGPIYSGGAYNEGALLYSCYKKSLELARKNGAESIAFPLISSGIYGYPKSEALKVATRAVMDFLENNDMEVFLAVYDKSAFEISAKLFSDVEEYITENLVIPEDRERRLASEDMADFAAIGNVLPSQGAVSLCEEKTCVPDVDIEDMLKKMDASFSEYLLFLIDKSGMRDAEVYKKANVDRKLFSKIRNNPSYKPSKITAVAFAIALGLDMEKSRDLLGRAGYALTRSSKFDIIIEYFIMRKNYNIFEINEVLFAFDQPLIGV